MRRYLDLTSWILLFFFAPFTVLILLSQNTLPGDFLYPVKIGLENMILVAASVSPSTKVAFRTDLTQRRFTEAQQLLVSKGDTAAYNSFVSEVASAQQDLSALSNPKDKLESSDKLIAKIEQYQQQLTQVQNQVQVAQNIATSQPVSPTSVPSQTIQNPIQPTASTNQTFITPTPATSQMTPHPSPSPSNTSAPIASTIPQATVFPSTPIASSIPTPPPLAPSVTNTIVNNPVKSEEIKKTIDNTKDELAKIKDKLEKEKEDAQFKEKVKEIENKEGKNGSGESPSNHQ